MRKLVAAVLIFATTLLVAFAGLEVRWPFSFKYHDTLEVCHDINAIAPGGADIMPEGLFWQAVPYPYPLTTDGKEYAIPINPKDHPISLFRLRRIKVAPPPAKSPTNNNSVTPPTKRIK
jgi:hypothetical protein